MFKIKKDEHGKSVYLFGHKVLRLGGTSVTSVGKKIDTLDKFLKKFFVITQIAPASGLLRDVQLAQLKMLKEIDWICQENKLSYWLEFGTLIGAVRHKGFIPWDDDVDICMMRDDYDKFIDIFNQNTSDPDLYATKRSSETGFFNCINVYHRNISLITIDIFPCDFCYKTYNDEEKIEFSKLLKKLSKSNKPNLNKLSIEEYHASYRKIRDDNIPNLLPQPDIKNPSIFFGIEFLHRDHAYNVFDYETIFPLRKIKFEDYEFSSVNCPDIHLTYLYRDYMSMPKNITCHHNIASLPMTELITLKKYMHKGFENA